jgi:pyruvate/2-oxoglutarate dehydrogenase complex dihydrolipoamide acyltransferase (E2) component
VARERVRQLKFNLKISPAEVHRRFVGKCCIHLQGRKVNQATSKKKIRGAEAQQKGVPSSESRAKPSKKPAKRTRAARYSETSVNVYRVTRRSSQGMVHLVVTATNTSNPT